MNTWLHQNKPLTLFAVFVRNKNAYFSSPPCWWIYSQHGRRTWLFHQVSNLPNEFQSILTSEERIRPFYFIFFWWIIAMLATIFLSSSQRRTWKIFVVEQLSDPWAKIQGLLSLLAFWWWWGGAVDFRKVLVRIANLFIYTLSKYILSACNQKTLKWTLGKQEWSHHTWVFENSMEDISHCVQCLQSLPRYNKANTEQAHLIYCWDQGKL